MRPCIKIIGGPVWQWDSGRRVEARGAFEVHFAREGADAALAVRVDEDGTAEIPNQLLTEDGIVLAWRWDGARTGGAVSIPVAGRAKPSDYICTPTEVETVESLKAWVEERIAEIDSTGGVRIGHGLKLEDGAIAVDCAEAVEQDNTLPITSAAVYVEVGNIEALLATV